MKSATLLLASLQVTTAAAQSVPGQFFTVDRYATIDRVLSPQISPDGNRIVYVRAHADTMKDSWVNVLWVMQSDGTRPQELLRGTSPRWSPDGSRIAYLGEADGKTQLFVRSMDAEGRQTQLTRGEMAPISFRWAPDSRSIAYTMVVPDSSTWSVALPQAPGGAQWAPPPTVVDRMHYRADRKGEIADGWTHLFIVPLDGSAPRQLTHGAFNVGARALGIPEDPSFDWMPDGKSLVIDGNDAADAELQYRTSNIYGVDAASGELHRLTSEPGYWHAPAVSPDGKWVAFTGFNRTRDTYHTSDLLVMHPDGTVLRLLTSGVDRDPQSVMWADNETIFFTAEDHGSVNTWTASMSGKAPASKPASNGVHVLSLGSLSLRASTGVATRSASQQPAEIVKFTFKKAWDLKQVSHVTDAVLSGIQLGDVEEIDLHSTGDTRLQGWITKPPNFDQSKKYPLLLEIHGGPHAMANVAFAPAFQNFAASGFMVLSVNPRGSTGYGSAFGNAINKAYPGVDYDDLMAAVNEAIVRGFVDTTRMYVSGCSGGGVLSAWIIGHTHRFAAAAVRCPVTDWISFAGESDVPMLTQNFFDRPFWEDPAPWLAHSPIMFAGNISTPTLIMTGELDLRTPMPQSEQLYEALKSRGVPTVLLRFNGEYHGTGSKPSNWMRTQLYMTSWFNRYGGK